GHTVAQRQVLGARRGADRVGLHEAQALDRARQNGGLEQAARDGMAAQVIEGQGAWHGAMMPRRQDKRPARAGRCAWSAWAWRLGPPAPWGDASAAPKPRACCRKRRAYSPAAARSVWALSVFSQLNSGSSRPKWP